MEEYLFTFILDKRSLLVNIKMVWPDKKMQGVHTDGKDGVRLRLKDVTHGTA